MNPTATLRLANQVRTRVAPLCLYRIELANSLEWAGRCNFKTRTIELSLEFMQAYTPEQVTQIVLHELAHALRGPTPANKFTGHDSQWEKVARRLGYEHGPTVPETWPSPRIVWNKICTNTGEILETPNRPLPTCNICNACTPQVERRQYVPASTYNIQIPKPRPPFTSLKRRLKDLLTGLTTVNPNP